MTTNTILAIDLGRFKSVPCVYSRSTRHHAFRTIDSKPDALAELPLLLIDVGCEGDASENATPTFVK